MDEFRKLVQALQKWLKESEGNMPVVEISMSTKELQKQIEHLEVGREMTELYLSEYLLYTVV